MSARCGACAGPLSPYWYDIHVAQSTHGAAVEPAKVRLCELCFVESDALVRAYVDAAGERKNQANG